ncbi:type II toxin-antitoxin system prevent-host-death family antitoxin [Rubrobacter indicoceani]|uniref:type II toxin-antitoxin system prevent-host-death family antitoxin n=1 Tax=Rubrobacter indicoceani TaxID=2051957 RepID=UPI000E5A4B18|nr:type II toxin-antitoxin system prevent-host-death family antitoxin [Rubrobacter indicoceani]
MTVDHIPLEKLRRSLGQVAQDVERGGSVVVERRGEEAFALVPMRLYRLLEEERRSVIEATRRARESFSDLSEKEIESLVSEEMAAVKEEGSSSKAGS